MAETSWGILVDTDLGKLIDELDVDRPLMASMQRRLGNTYNRAVRLWPVKTRFSKDRLYFKPPASDGIEIVSELGCDAWYAILIPSTPAQDLLLAPVDRDADLILRDTAEMWGF